MNSLTLDCKTFFCIASILIAEFNNKDTRTVSVAIALQYIDIVVLTGFQAVFYPWIHPLTKKMYHAKTRLICKKSFFQS